jgi:hypothetical protein
MVENPLLAEIITAAGAVDVHYLPIVVRDRGAVGEYFAELERKLARPGRFLQKQMDAVDPTGDAIVYAGSAVRGVSFCNRRLLGTRSLQAYFAERKDNQPTFLSDHPSLHQRFLRRVTLDRLREVVAEYSRDGAFVLTGIPRGYLEAGSSHTFLIPPGLVGTELVHRTIARIVESCWGVRITRFVPGCPATYYGFVSSARTVCWGPFEALSYWDLSDLRIRSIGIQAPIVPDTAEARAVVTQAAARLASATGYAGAFCINGVFAGGEFIATDLNPRSCSGHRFLEGSWQPPVPTLLVDLVIRTHDPKVTVELMDEVESLAMRSCMQPRLYSFGWLGELEEKLVSECPSGEDRNAAEIQRWNTKVRATLRLPNWLPIRSLDTHCETSRG